MGEQTWLEVELNESQHHEIKDKGGETLTTEAGSKMLILPEGEKDGDIWVHRVVRLN